MCVISQMFLDLLEQPVDEQQDGEAITKAKHLYASCIDTGAWKGFVQLLISLASAYCGWHL